MQIPIYIILVAWLSTPTNRPPFKMTSCTYNGQFTIIQQSFIPNLHTFQFICTIECSKQKIPFFASGLIILRTAENRTMIYSSKLLSILRGFQKCIGCWIFLKKNWIPLISLTWLSHPKNGPLLRKQILFLY